jgi:hypothetical protein
MINRFFGGRQEAQSYFRPIAIESLADKVSALIHDIHN